jgi:hypothetical protein
MVFNDVNATAVVRARIEASLGAVATFLARTVSATDAAASTVVYSAPSRTPGQSYEVAVTGNQWGITLSCNCPAGQNSRPCWHAGLVTLAMEEEARRPVRVGRAA